MTPDRSALIRKYNVPGPRYTSYPTVPYWEHTPTEKEWIEALRNSLAPSPHASGERVGVRGRRGEGLSVRV